MYNLSYLVTEHHFYPCASGGVCPQMRISTPIMHQYRGIPGMYESPRTPHTFLLSQHHQTSILKRFLFQGSVNQARHRLNYVPTTPIWSAHTSADVHGLCAANLTPNATPGCLRMKTSPGWSGHSQYCYS